MTEQYMCARAQLYQMYFVIAKLDVQRLATLDFIVNFGITPE